MPDFPKVRPLIVTVKLETGNVAALVDMINNCSLVGRQDILSPATLVASAATTGKIPTAKKSVGYATDMLPPAAMSLVLANERVNITFAFMDMRSDADISKATLPT